MDFLEGSLARKNSQYGFTERKTSGDAPPSSGAVPSATTTFMGIPARLSDGSEQSSLHYLTANRSDAGLIIFLQRVPKGHGNHEHGKPAHDEVHPDDPPPGPGRPSWASRPRHGPEQHGNDSAEEPTTSVADVRIRNEWTTRRWRRQRGISGKGLTEQHRSDRPPVPRSTPFRRIRNGMKAARKTGSLQRHFRSCSGMQKWHPSYPASQASWG